ncbi:MAG: Tex family protein [Eubacteriales bacterium]|nr:Tex family protein [Eubacteriales bacterium]
MNIAEIISAELSIRPQQAEAVIELIDEGNTIPFIARYRKEAHGNLNDEILRKLEERLQYLRNLEDRKKTVLASIEEQGKLTDELREKIEAAMTALSLEDIYRPYKPKRRTRAMIARERGLLPLAETILRQDDWTSVAALAESLVNPEKEIENAADAFAGAKDIIAEQIADSADCRSHIRKRTEALGLIVSKAKDAEAKSVYEGYYDYSEPVSKIPGHRILALNRGEREKLLRVGIEAPEDELTAWLCKRLVRHPERKETAALLSEAAEDSYKRLIAPSVETEVRGELTDRAEEGAIRIFGQNLRQLLLQPPITGKTVLGWDPAFRTGCKLAVTDSTGKVLDTCVIYPTAPQNRVEEAKRTLLALIKKYKIDVISVGNGTASRESEQIIAEFIRENRLSVQYAIVNEAGASVYSASKLASEEFPQFDVGQRSAASIARRLQDPLSELVKIEPKAIGVGQYQHDMNQTRLSDALTAVVEDCVNSVGADLNTASAALLQYVSGISKTVAQNIVAYREANGRFKSRRELLKVAKLGPKAYEQCAGFLRIKGGTEALDATAVHPESYETARQLLGLLGYSEDALENGGIPGIAQKLGGKKQAEEAAKELGTGVFTLLDIAKELEKPGRDPREDAPAPVLKQDVLSMEDLKEGMILTGTVRNVIDFGAFVDIGVHQDGLVHISQLSHKFIKHPSEAVKLGDVVQVKVLSVDPEKKRIALSMKL